MIALVAQCLLLWIYESREREFGGLAFLGFLCRSDRFTAITVLNQAGLKDADRRDCLRFLVTFWSPRSALWHGSNSIVNKRAYVPAQANRRGIPTHADGKLERLEQRPR